MLGRMYGMPHFDPPLHGDGFSGQAGALLELHVALHELVHGDLAVAIHVQCTTTSILYCLIKFIRKW